MPASLPAYVRAPNAGLQIQFPAPAPCALPPRRAQAPKPQSPPTPPPQSTPAPPTPPWGCRTTPPAEPAATTPPDHRVRQVIVPCRRTRSTRPCAAMPASAMPYCSANSPGVRISSGSPAKAASSPARQRHPRPRQPAKDHDRQRQRRALQQHSGQPRQRAQRRHAVAGRISRSTSNSACAWKRAGSSISNCRSSSASPTAAASATSASAASTLRPLRVSAGSRSG